MTSGRNSVARAIIRELGADTLKEMSARLGVSPDTIAARVYRGLPVAEILTAGKLKKYKRHKPGRTYAELERIAGYEPTTLAIRLNGIGVDWRMVPEAELREAVALLERLRDARAAARAAEKAAKAAARAAESVARKAERARLAKERAQELEKRSARDFAKEIATAANWKERAKGHYLVLGESLTRAAERAGITRQGAWKAARREGLTTAEWLRRRLK